MISKRRAVAALFLSVVLGGAVALMPARADAAHRNQCANTTCDGTDFCEFFAGAHCTLNGVSCSTRPCQQN